MLGTFLEERKPREEIKWVKTVECGWKRVYMHLVAVGMQGQVFISDDNVTFE